MHFHLLASSLKMKANIFVLVLPLVCLEQFVLADRIFHRNHHLHEDTPYRLFKSSQHSAMSHPVQVAPEESQPHNTGVIRSTDSVMMKRYPKHDDSVMPFNGDDDERDPNERMKPSPHHYHPRNNHDHDRYRIYRNDHTGTANPAQCSSPDQRKGMCYEASECIDRGGIPMGACGPTGSVCCLFEATCGQSVSERHIYFRNAGLLPTSTHDSSQFCRLKVNKIQGTDVCQLKLVFETLDIARPIEGNCSQDIFSVSGQNENFIVPRICGLNTGQHYYIGVDESGLINLQFMLRGQYARKWNIHIEQLPCGSSSLAPPHCLQYYEGTQGTIKSFNYDSDEGRDTSSHSQGYPNNMDYIVCIRKETGFCSISYEFMSDSSGSLWPFSVGPAAVTNGDLVMSDTESRKGQRFRSLSNCDDDYLVVGGMRLCSKIVNFNENDGDDDQSTTSSTLSNGSTLMPSEEITSIDVANGTNGQAREGGNEFIESSGASQPLEMERDETLRRAHRRATQHSRLYYDEPMMSPSHGRRFGLLRGTRVALGRGESEKASNPNHHIMAIDSTPGPFLLRFVANSAKNAKGFYLSYRQNPCKV